MSYRVLLAGDVCEDSFIWGEVTKLSAEAPVPVFVPEKAASNPGMAGNVLANILTLSTDIEVDTLFPEGASTKVRHIDKRSNQHLIRLDSDYISKPLDINIVKSVIKANKYDAVVLSDYDKGWLNSDNMGQIADLCYSNSIPTFADTKQLLSTWSNNITFVKINDKELKLHFKYITNPWARCQNLIVTKGKDGMVLYYPDGQESYSTCGNNTQVADVSGAGDSVLAALVVKYLETKDIKHSMDWANKVAQIAVSRRGVVTVNRSEIL